MFVHDARRPRGGAEGSLRSVAALHRPDVVVIWLHPATLADGLAAARAVRHAGTTLVLGAGPLIDLWPDGARLLPELDGLLASSGRAALLAALEVVSTGGPAGALRDALGTPAAAGATDPPDRKLVDYAAYRRCARGGWPGQPDRPPSGLLRFGPPVDKGRGATTAVPLHDDVGGVLPPEAVVDDVVACDLLGIRWLDLTAGTGAAPHPTWWSDLLGRVRLLRAGPGALRRLRIAVQPADVARLPLSELTECGVAAIDLGDLDAGDAVQRDTAVAAAAACRSAGVEPWAAVALGAPGYALRDEQDGLDAIRGAGVEVDVGAATRPGVADPVAWRDWLEAPSASFVPPDVDPARLDLARRLRRVQAARARGGPGRSEGLAGRLRRVLSSDR